MKYDFIILGGGSAGLVAAKFAKGLGKKTAIIEKNKIGGDCTHFGCVPSKALLKTSEISRNIRDISKYGLSLKGDIDTSDAFAHVRKIISDVYSHGNADTIRKEGIDVIEGGAVFKDAKTVTVNGVEYTAEKFLIATGSSPVIPPIEGLSEINYLTNENIFDLESVPESVAVIGGGPIGVELAYALNGLGCDVAVIESADNILPIEDSEITDRLKDKLKNDGIKILTNTKVMSVEQKDGYVSLKTDGEYGEVKAVRVLVATGRKPNIDTLNLKSAGVEYNKNAVLTDKYLRTTAKNIYAAGDVVPPYRFSHVSDYEAVIATGNALLPIKRKADYSDVGWCTFTSPELARWGLTEKEAKDKYGDKVRVFRFEASAADRAITDMSTEGMAKYITGKKGNLLGAHILSESAGEIIHEVILAKKHKIPFQKLAEMIHIYPTYSYMVRQPSKYAGIQMFLENPIVKFFRGLKK